MKKWMSFLLLLLIAIALPAQAALTVLACEPEWGALLQELGGDKLAVHVATSGRQDPHRVQARPSLIAQARSADLLVCTGAGLEDGWLPILLRQSGNGKIQLGRVGYFEAAGAVRLLEAPSRLDRAEGDVHPGGNPHIQTDPRNIALVAEALGKRLGQLDPANQAYYQQRLADFSRRWTTALQGWEKQASRLRGMPIVVQHNGFPYLENWLGLRQVGVLEAKPGVEPSSAYLAEMLERLRHQPARMVIRAAYHDGRPSEWLAERAKIPALALPFAVGGSEQAKDLFSLFDETIWRLLEAAR